MAVSIEMTDAFESFAHSLRIMLEANLRGRELLMIDPHEAVGNIEQSLTQVLNSIASIYDACQKIDDVRLEWHTTAETAFILAVRNARHHNHANRIRGLYDYHLRQPAPEKSRKYVYVDYPETKDGGKAFDVPVSWYDFAKLLDLPQKINRIRPPTLEIIQEYLSVKKFNTYSSIYEVPEENVFFNINPLIVNSAIKFVPIIKPHIEPRSNEGVWFASHFENVYGTNAREHEIHEFNVFIDV